jgi:hypothetical protein
LWRKYEEIIAMISNLSSILAELAENMEKNIAKFKY